MRRAFARYALLMLLFGLAVPRAGAETSWSAAYRGKDDDAGLAFGADVIESRNGYFVSSSMWIVSEGQVPAVFFVTTDGDVAWAKRFDDWRYGGPPSMDATPTGGVVLAGGYSLLDEPRTRVIRLDASGEVLWDKIYELAAGGRIRTLRNGGFVLSGGSRPTVDSGPDGAWVLRLNADGAVVWKAVYPLGFGACTADIRELAGGELLVAGTDRKAGRDLEMWVMRLSDDGSVVWAAGYGGPGADRASALVVTGDGHLFLAGSTAPPTGTGVGPALSSAAILQLTPGGEIAAQRALRGDRTRYAMDMDLTSRGTFVIAGKSGLVGGRLWAVEIDRNWDLVWKRRYGFASFGAKIRSTSDGGSIVGASKWGKYSPAPLKLDRMGSVPGGDCELTTTVVTAALDARQRSVAPIFAGVVSRDVRTRAEDVAVVREVATFSCTDPKTRIAVMSGPPVGEVTGFSRPISVRRPGGESGARRVSTGSARDVTGRPTGVPRTPTSSDSPSRLTARVDVAGGPDKIRSGTLEITWIDATTWKQELSLDDYRRTISVADGSKWVEQNAPYPPLWAFDLDRLLEFDGEHASLVSGASTKKGTAAEALQCTEFESERGSVEACAEPRTGALRQLSYVESLAPGVSRRSVYHYEEAVDFAGERFPSRMEMTVGPRKVVAVEIARVEPLPPGTPDGDGSAGLRTNASCRHRDPAIEMEPRQPAGLPSRGGTAVVRFVVARDGSLHDIELLATGDSEAAAPSIERLGLESWLPALCDGIAVDSVAIVAGDRTVSPPDRASSGRLRALD